MEMLVLLLVSAVAHLVCPAPANHPLIHVIAEATNYNTNLYQDYLVEDVTDLKEAGCHSTFYCKVQQILNDHHKNTKDRGNMKVLRTLNVFINEREIKCVEALKNVRKSDKRRTLPALLDNLLKCSRLTNFKEGLKTTCICP